MQPNALAIAFACAALALGCQTSADAPAEAPYGADRVVTHAGYVYFTNYQTLARVPVSGGPREDLALHTSVGDVVVTNDALYWTDADAGKLYVRALR